MIGVTASLRVTALDYIMKYFAQDTLIPPILKSKMKSDCGINHPVSSHMLCPQALLNKFDEAPQ